MTEVTEAPRADEQQEWDAKQYEESLIYLEGLQEQVMAAPLTPRHWRNMIWVTDYAKVDTLRSALPSVVAPLLSRNASKAQIFAEVKKAALQSTDSLKSFREGWQSEQTQRILARSKESLQKDGELGKGNEVARYGWSEQ